MTNPQIDISAKDLNIRYGKHHIVHDVNFDVYRGRITGLVGESGSGKTTLAKSWVGVNPVSSGSLSVLGVDLSAASRGERKRLLRKVQMIPQDPYSSLSPRRSVAQTLAEAIDPVRGSMRRYQDEIVELIESMHLPADSIYKMPYQFSGGQRQRIAIARALAVRPKVIIADEITSALDVSVQAEILDLIRELFATSTITMVFISHNLAVVSNICSDIMIMESGLLVETGAVSDVFTHPTHPYTKRLLSAIPGSKEFTL